MLVDSFPIENTAGKRRDMLLAGAQGCYRPAAAHSRSS